MKTNEHKKGFKAKAYPKKSSVTVAPLKPRNPVAKNASAAIGGGASGAHKDKKKADKQGDVKHKKSVATMAEGVAYDNRLDQLLNTEFESTGVNEMRNQRDAYQRDYDSSISGFSRPADHRGLGQELAHERNNLAVSINGKLWKVFPGQGTADSQEEYKFLSKMKDWAEKKSFSTGKKWTVSLTGADPTESVAEDWSKKYKSSINCSHPKGFSQKAHCAGKKKHNESTEMEMTCEDCGMCQTHGDHMMEVKQRLDAKCWKGKHKEGTKIKGGVRVNNCVPNEGVAEATVDPYRGLLMALRQDAGRYIDTKGQAGGRNFLLDINQRLAQLQQTGNPRAKVVGDTVKAMIGDAQRTAVTTKGVSFGTLAHGLMQLTAQELQKVDQKPVLQPPQQGVAEGSTKHQMHHDAERMSRKQFCDKYGDEHGEFWDNIMGDLDEAAKHGLYYNVNKRKAAGTSRPASSPKAPTAQAWKDAAKTAKKESYSGEYDDEAGMADNNLETLKRAVDGLDNVINAGDNLPEWCQEKIAIAKSMLVNVWDYMQSEERK